MSNQNIITGTYTGTAAALNLEIGFIPSIFKVYDSAGALQALWDSNMDDGCAILQNEYIDSLLDPAKPSIGTTPANIAHAAFRFRVAGVPYLEAALAAGAAPTATTIPQNKWGLFQWEIGADGTLDTGPDAAGNATGYASEALAIAAAPAASSAHCRVMRVTVKRTNVAGFVGATTSFADAETTYNCYEVTDNKIITGGFTQYATTFRGLTIGTSAYVNKLGQAYYYEAIR